MTSRYVSYCYWNPKWLTNFSCISATREHCFKSRPFPASSPRAPVVNPVCACWVTLLPRGSEVGREGRGQEVGHESCSCPLRSLSACVLEKFYHHRPHFPPPSLPFYLSLGSSRWGTCREKECAGHTSRMQAHIPGWDSGNINWEAPTAVGDCQLLTHPGSRLAPTKSVVFK